jgi:hypothetical protein
MALNKKRNSRLDQLVAAAAADIKERIPSLGAQEQRVSETEYQELEQVRQGLERVWDEIDRQANGSSASDAGAHAVDEDRGRQGESLYWFSVGFEITSLD